MEATRDGSSSARRKYLVGHNNQRATSILDYMYAPPCSTGSLSIADCCLERLPAICRPSCCATFDMASHLTLLSTLGKRAAYVAFELSIATAELTLMVGICGCS